MLSYSDKAGRDNDGVAFVEASHITPSNLICSSSIMQPPWKIGNVADIAFVEVCYLSLPPLTYVNVVMV